MTSVRAQQWGNVSIWFRKLSAALLTSGHQSVYTSQRQRAAIILSRYCETEAEGEHSKSFYVTSQPTLACAHSYQITFTPDHFYW